MMTPPTLPIIACNTPAINGFASAAICARGKTPSASTVMAT
jgi:hypothetical protein